MLAMSIASMEPETMWVGIIAVVLILSIAAIFVGYIIMRDRSDRREAELNRQQNATARAECHGFQNTMNNENVSAWKIVANAMTKYTEAMTHQADRHNKDNEIHLLRLQNEELKIRLEETHLAARRSNPITETAAPSAIPVTTSPVI